ncbi:MAG: bifunctional precorrin-2 dehydrogenase/sirohydrochlorin ferrochelatase [Candidatus Riflebacteria bacterium]|nr:bifunctional precorrin-2 dehydrogenase/sirohydrochlorin ferrochelatase [Candidatus Riflebacteria bacterium]
MNLRNRPVLIVGGGDVATRKAEGLSHTGACLTVIAPAISDAITGIPDINALRRPATETDINDSLALVILATDCPELQERLALRCRALRVPVNRCDAPEDSDFVTGSLIDRPPVLAAVTSSGSPTISRLVRRRLETALEPALLDLGRLLNDIRPSVKKCMADPVRREAFFRTWGTEEAVTKIREQGADAVREEMQRCLF